jgi:predicted RNase H-like nuclease
LISANGIVLEEVGPEVGLAGVDDVLDAAAAAWTARRRDRGTARAHPQPPQVFSDGISCAIWA